MQADEGPDVKSLNAKIGELTMERAFYHTGGSALERKREAEHVTASRFDVASDAGNPADRDQRKATIQREPKQEKPSISRQCEIIIGACLVAKALNSVPLDTPPPWRFAWSIPPTS